MAYKVKSGDTVSQIAKRMGVRIQDIVAANPNLKDVNKIRVGQSLKIPKPRKGKNIGSQGPYGRTSKTEMAMMRKSGEQYTTGVRAKMKAGAETTPTPKKAKATKDAKSGRSAMLAKAKAKRDAMPLPKSKPKTEIAKKKRVAQRISALAKKAAEKKKATSSKTKKMALPKSRPTNKKKKVMDRMARLEAAAKRNRRG
jgi:murein DD-endopeptidase MepM/ murein hydrolase activator NlpD